MAKQIKCMNCNHIWNSSAKELTSRGVYCRNCNNTDIEKLSWVSGYTDTPLKHTKGFKKSTDFLQQNQSVQESKKSEDIPKSTEDTKTKTKDDTITEETKRQLIVDKIEKVVTKTGKGKFRTRGLDDIIRSLLILGEQVQNKRFEASGYTYRYGEGQSEILREDMLSAFQDAYGVELELSPKQEFYLLASMYSTPTIYHEARYKSFGVKIKTWYSKTSSKLKERAAKRDIDKEVKKEEKQKKKPLSKQDIDEEIEKLDTISET